MLRPRREYYNAIRGDLSLNVLYAGHERCAPGHGSEGVRDHFLFHYVEAGSGTVRMAGRTSSLDAGGGFLYAPGEPLWYQASMDDPWEYRWVGFAGAAATATLHEAGIGTNVAWQGRNVSLELRDSLAELTGVLRARSPGYRLRAEGYLYFILAAVREALDGTPDTSQRTVRRRRNAGASTYVNEAIKFIRMNYQRPLSVNAVVDYIGLDRSYLSTLFLKTVGISIRDYLIRHRMRRARALLLETTYSIGQVAQSVGYPSYFAFARRFKQTTGRTPTQYRREAGVDSPIGP